VYNCDKPNPWSRNQAKTAAENLNTVFGLKAALGVDATTIRWMYGESRQEAYGRGDGVSTQAMLDAFHSLSPDDSYFVSLSEPMMGRYPGARWSRDLSVSSDLGKYFGSNVLSGVATFITVAKYDWNIWSPGIADGLNAIASSQDVVSSASYGPTDTHAPYTSLSLPGLLTINYQSQKSSTPRYVPMLTSYDSGHAVTMRAPAAGALLADVTKWYSASPH
jgi:hypothetical protein